MVEMMNHQEMNISSSSGSTLVDMSSFWLFESTGDSEFDTNFYSEPMDSSFTINPSHQRFLVDDDAQSSNEDTELNFRIENEDNHDDDNDDDDEVDSSSCCRVFNRRSVGWNNDVKDEDEDDEDEGDVVEQRWMNGVNRCKKSKSSVSSVVDSEFKSQKDKDKLFWETCLAS